MWHGPGDKRVLLDEHFHALCTLFFHAGADPPFTTILVIMVMVIFVRVDEFLDDCSIFEFYFFIRNIPPITSLRNSFHSFSFQGSEGLAGVIQKHSSTVASHCSLELRPRWFIVGPLTSNFDPKETKVESEEFQIKRTLKDQKCFPKPKLLYKELGRLAPLRTSHHKSLQRAEVHYPVNAKKS